MMDPGPNPRVKTTAKWVWNLVLSNSPKGTVLTVTDTLPAALINGRMERMPLFLNFGAWADTKDTSLISLLDFNLRCSSSFTKNSLAGSWRYVYQVPILREEGMATGYPFKGKTHRHRNSMSIWQHRKIFRCQSCPTTAFNQNSSLEISLFKPKNMDSGIITLM